MFYNAFPSNLSMDVNSLINIMPHQTFCNVSFVKSEDSIVYALEAYEVEIPYRMYLQDIADTAYAMLSPIQKQILCCIYTRSCDGYVREKYVRKLLDMPFEQWCIPFIVKLCDEYILEILEVIYEKLKERDNADIQEFCLRNKAAVRKGYARMISYWNVYHRGRKQTRKEYIGSMLFEECLGYNKTFEK